MIVGMRQSPPRRQRRLALTPSCPPPNPIDPDRSKCVKDVHRTRYERGVNINSSSRFGIRLSSALACFRRAEMALDFVSYDVLPPLHARRLLRTMLAGADDYDIERIHVLSPIEWTWCSVQTGSGARRALGLKNAVYQIDVRKRSRAGGHDVALVGDAAPHLGLKDFPAAVSLVPSDAGHEAGTDGDDVDLGWLPVALDPAPPRRTIFQRLRMRDGIIDLSRQDEALRAS